MLFFTNRKQIKTLTDELEQQKQVINLQFEKITELKLKKAKIVKKPELIKKPVVAKSKIEGEFNKFFNNFITFFNSESFETKGVNDIFLVKRYNLQLKILKENLEYYDGYQKGIKIIKEKISELNKKIAELNTKEE